MKQQLDFERILREEGILLSDRHRERLSLFVDGVREWNSKINLVSRKDEENIWLGHVLHSVTPLMFIEFRPRWKVLDLGTGGGFPGLPLAILRDDISFTLVDSIQKKITALRDIVARTGVENVSVIASRGEEVGKQREYRNMFDVVTARAVAPLADLVKWSRPLLKRGDASDTGMVKDGGGKLVVGRSFLLAMKGGDLGGEIRTVQIKYGIAHVGVVDIVFDGSAEIGLEEKKLVVVPGH